MEYVSAREKGDMWGISQRRVSALCAEGRIEGAKFVGNMWIIPQNAEKPIDPRCQIEDKNKMIPFVKWAGGKRQILSELKSRMPSSFDRYYEPFVGGGALFFDLELPRVTINDINQELIAVYRSLKDEELYQNLLKRLDAYQEEHNKCSTVEEAQEFFYSIRKIDQEIIYETLPLYEKAARMIYLNKTCFNGLYRVNAKGYFNVPFAKKLPVTLYSIDNFEKIHKYMTNSDIEITSTDFKSALKNAKSGDFVYFDPPYDKIKKEKELSTSFTSYAKDGFEEKEQIELADLFKELSLKGVYCMLSNHNTDLIQNLYKDFNIDVINARRAINSIGSGRGPVEEVIIRNYE